MRLHRFIGNFNFENERIRIEDNEIINQIKKVLRLRPGDVAILSDGRLNEAEARITDMERDFLEMELLKKKRNENEPAVCATLYCSVLKKENFEFIAQKVTEVGISKIVPISTIRTVKMNLKEERLEKIIREAAEQSERGMVPKLERIMTFEEAVEYAKENEMNIFFDRSGEKLMRDLAGKIKSVGIFIGPEGGWDQSEIEKAKDAGFKIMSMGKLNFRAETAAIISSYLVTGGG